MTPFRLLVGDALEQLRTMPDESVQTCVTSPPYWGLRDYGVEGQIGLEPTSAEFIKRLLEVFREVRRVLRPDGTAWVNLGDTYASAGYGSAQHTSRQACEKLSCVDAVLVKPKDLCGIPWRVALALQADGWWLRSDIIWSKPNAMPESVLDRPSKSHEYVFLLTKSAEYFYDADAIRTPLAAKTLTTFVSRRKGKAGDALGKVASANWGRDVPVRKPKVDAQGVPLGANARSVWTIASTPSRLEHFATFPEELARRCIVAGSSTGDMVLDPFAGTGTTGIVAMQEGRRFVGVELNPAYAAMAERRSREVTPSLFLAGGAA